jgi:hypothetical protein
MTLGGSTLLALKGAKTLVDVYKIVALGHNVFQAFEKCSVDVKPGQVVCVNERSTSNPLAYLSYSQYASLLRCKTMELLIINDKDTRRISIDTNSDDSWIIDETGCHKARYGTTREIDKDGPAASPWHPKG